MYGSNPELGNLSTKIKSIPFLGPYPLPLTNLPNSWLPFRTEVALTPIQHALPCSQCLRKGTGLEVVCLRPASNAWVLDFMQERVHNTSSGDFDGTFIKAGGQRNKGRDSDGRSNR